MATPAPDPREACALTGKSERTIRRWLASGALADLRPPGNVTAPIRVRTSELRGYLATLPEPLPRLDSAPPSGPPCPDVATPPPSDTGHPPDPLALALVAELRARVAVLEDLVAELRADKVRALDELARKREDLASTRQALDEERLARAAFERASAEAARAAAPAAPPAPSGGLRGLLSGLLRRG